MKLYYALRELFISKLEPSILRSLSLRIKFKKLIHVEINLCLSLC